jgi:hypothetical protein
MPITLHEAFVPSCLQVLGSVAALVDRAEAWCSEQGCDAAMLADARLHETMLPFPFQVKSVIHHSIGAIEGIRAGVAGPPPGEMPADFAVMGERLAAAIAALGAVTVDELEALVGKPMRFEMGSFKLPFTAESYLLSFAQPNFYFHASMIYAIMRAKGVGLGKRDFLGALRLNV